MESGYTFLRGLTSHSVGGMRECQRRETDVGTKQQLPKGQFAGTGGQFKTEHTSKSGYFFS